MPASASPLNRKVHASAATDAACSVLAVVVVYQRDLQEVESWPALRAALERAGSVPDGLTLRQVLIYDNSPQSRLPSEGWPLGVRVMRDTDNGGTVAAYAEAVRQARAEGIGWLLMLDHDTRPPDDLLPCAEATLRVPSADCIGAILPRVRHGDAPVSPSRLGWSGSIRPLATSESASADDRLTGIASGTLLRVAALADLPPVPPTLWLDYFDHWLFLHLRRAGHSVAISEAVLAHDLSVSNVGAMSRRRLQSMLDGEAEFSRHLPWPARAARPFRLLLRALRFGRVERSHFITVLRALRPLAGKRSS